MKRYRLMRWHLRLRQSDRKLLEAHVAKMQSGKTTILVAGYEMWDIKTSKFSPLHVHCYLESEESDDTLRRRVKSMGYSTGVDYYLKQYDNNEDNFRYMCKGSRRGEYDIGYISEDEGLKYHTEYWDTHDQIERRKDGSTARQPIYFQIVDHIQRNREHFEKLAYLLETDAEVLVEDYDESRDGAFVEMKSYLDEKKAVDYIIKRYSENGPLFDHETIKKCMWMVVSRLDRERATEKALRLIGTFKAEW